MPHILLQMPFLCFRSPLPDWFTAVTREDLEFIE